MKVVLANVRLQRPLLEALSRRNRLRGTTTTTR